MVWLCCLLSAFTHPHNAGVAFHHTLQSRCRSHNPISMHMPQLAASAAVLLTFVGLSKAAAAAAWPEMLDVCPWLHAYKALVHAAGFHQMLDGLDFVVVQYSLVDSIQRLRPADKVRTLSGMVLPMLTMMEMIIPRDRMLVQIWTAKAQVPILRSERADCRCGRESAPIVVVVGIA